MPETSRRLKDAAHEVRCWECRVTWTSWTQRLAGLKRGHTPRLSKRTRHLVAALRLAERQRDLWEADAKRYAGNADYWRERAERAEAEQ